MLLIILATGLAAGVICRRIERLAHGRLSAGRGAQLAAAEGWGSSATSRKPSKGWPRLGALLLLFSIGIEFSLEELIGLGRNFVVGGLTQMVLSAVPVALISHSVRA